jgi:hypothetical protein
MRFGRISQVYFLRDSPQRPSTFHIGAKTTINSMARMDAIYSRRRPGRLLRRLAISISFRTAASGSLNGLCSAKFTGFVLGRDVRDMNQGVL